MESFVWMELLLALAIAKLTGEAAVDRRYFDALCDGEKYKLLSPHRTVNAREQWNALFPPLNASIAALPEGFAVAIAKINPCSVGGIVSRFIYLLKSHRFQSHHDYDIMVLSVTVFVSGYAFCTLFIACELGQRMNDAFGGITIMIGQCDWQLFPIKVKRMLPAVLSILQQPVSLECFGSILCTREVFKQVCSTK